MDGSEKRAREAARSDGLLLDSYRRPDEFYRLKYSMLEERLEQVREIDGELAYEKMRRARRVLEFFGNLPRLILAWLCTEAVRTQNRVLVLGKSLSDFMRELDIYAGGGNAHTKLRNQMKRLFGCTVSLIYEDKNGQATVNALIARRRERAEFVMRVRLQSAA